ncbi:tetratricopeptide repeat protein [Myxococcus sp. K15C18031901]|uniref:tetratricopeptide repeat protein n=1 Tax=Myxococcus dinghuensis TaxID=2906761 RepID=UPI0020A6F063|nr:tetratricopeptide repeat protein [Myxococcus dinghuensis]MCP3101631.1 tetratricopeptide repeat protein [Myxococcus dinghuensis]
MKRLLSLLVVLAPLAVPAQQDSGSYNRALAAFNAGDYNTAAPLFLDVSEGAGDAQTRGKAEYFLAQSFAKKGLPVAAFISYAAIVNAGPSHPSYLKAVEGLVDMQQQLDEQNLIPSILNQAYTDEVRDQWVTLPREVLARINYLVGTVSQRRMRFEEARSLLEAVPKDSRVYAKSRYLLGVVLADPRFPGRPGEGDALDKEALAAFDAALSATEPQVELKATQHLSLIALGRVHYRRGEYAEASAAYERVPRYTRYWDQALFENGFARFQNEDFGGALGSLQALHAPQFAGAFQPESWILKATVYYFSCLYDEVKTTLAAFDEIYGPMAKQLEPFTADDQDLVLAYNLVAAENRRLPRPVYLWLRNNERIREVTRVLERVDAEKRELTSGAWHGTALSRQTVASLEDVRTTLLQVGGTLAKSRLREAADNLRTFSDQAEIIRVQTALDEKDLFQAGVDQKALLTRQSLYRPKMPGAAWNYWKFQGEFWIDEIGYYQYTLKRGCPAKSPESQQP